MFSTDRIKQGGISWIAAASPNGKDQEKDWVENQQKFAAIMGARLIPYDCGHYIHHFKSDEMCREIASFIRSLKQ